MGALAGRNLLEFAAKATTKDLTISSNALPVYAPAGMASTITGANISNSSLAVHAYLTGVQVSLSALQVREVGVNVSLSSLQILDNTPASVSKAVSTSSGTIKGSAGSLFLILGTTAGDVNIKDGNTEICRIAVTAGSVHNFGTIGIPFGTTISVSASAAVACYVYK